MKKTPHALFVTALLLTQSSMEILTAATFQEDVDFLAQHSQVIVLGGSGEAQVAVVPAYQGRIMTSTLAGGSGLSYGWVNRELIASGRVQPHINVFGGEDRFWLGPEGGQFSIFFAKDAPFNLENWFTPAAIDTEPYSVVSQGPDRVQFRHSLQLTNYSSFVFQLEVNREVRLVSVPEYFAKMGVVLPAGLKSVGFESVNTIQNTGPQAWTRETGLLSIWILGMFNASPQTTVVIPFREGPAAELGPVVNDAYFGKVPAHRLKVANGILYFLGDGNDRSKIGISPRRAKPVLGSYDEASQTLTLAYFTLPSGTLDYVNSMWELQKEPYAGDAVNSYNDGPPQPGAPQLGKFYELESSSPALALAPNASASHSHLTLHIQGSPATLNMVARAALGVGLEQIEKAF